MASLHITTDPFSSIDYSLVDGRIRKLVIRGECWYDEHTNIAVDGWQHAAATLIVELGLHIEKGIGRPAFIYKMIEDGLLPA